MTSSDEIDGVFEGELVVEHRLQVRGNGVVKGTIRYGELTVEKGGRLYGDIAATSENGLGPRGGSTRLRPAAERVQLCPNQAGRQDR